MRQNGGSFVTLVLLTFFSLLFLGTIIEIRNYDGKEFLISGEGCDYHIALPFHALEFIGEDNHFESSNNKNLYHLEKNHQQKIIPQLLNQKKKKIATNSIKTELKTKKKINISSPKRKSMSSLPESIFGGSIFSIEEELLAQEDLEESSSCYEPFNFPTNELKNNRNHKRNFTISEKDFNFKQRKGKIKNLIKTKSFQGNLLLGGGAAANTPERKINNNNNHTSPIFSRSASEQAYSPSMNKNFRIGTQNDVAQVWQKTFSRNG